MGAKDLQIFHRDRFPDRDRPFGHSCYITHLIHIRVRVSGEASEANEKRETVRILHKNTINIILLS